MTNNTSAKTASDTDLVFKRITWRIEQCPRLAKSRYCDGCPVFAACVKFYDTITSKSIEEHKKLSKGDYQVAVSKITKIQEMVK
jgi:hypothetical protein